MDLIICRLTSYSYIVITLPKIKRAKLCDEARYDSLSWLYFVFHFQVCRCITHCHLCRTWTSHKKDMPQS